MATKYFVEVFRQDLPGHNLDNNPSHHDTSDIQESDESAAVARAEKYAEMLMGVSDVVGAKAILVERVLGGKDKVVRVIARGKRYNVSERKYRDW